MVKKQGKIHYAWWILISCCALYGAGIGVIGNTAGLYLAPVAQEMGWPRGSLNYYMTIIQIVMTICLPFAGRLFERVNVKVLLSAGVMGMALTYILSSTFTAIWHWYVAGISLGVWYSIILYLPGPLLINNWFSKHVGLALGITVAFASITAAFANPIGGWIIGEYGWRTARVVLGCAAIVIAMPFMLFVVRYKPAEMGLKPYGYDAAQDFTLPGSTAKKLSGVRAESAIRFPSLFYVIFIAGFVAITVAIFKKTPSIAVTALIISVIMLLVAIRSLAFYFVFLLAGIIVFCASMHAQTPGYAASIGLSPTVGAFAVSIIMVGGVVGKLVLGWLSDRIGATNTAVLAMLLGALGAASILVGGTNIPMFYAGAFLFGFGYAALTIVPPLVVRSYFGQIDYNKVYSYITMAFGYFGGVAPSVYGMVFDVTGSFRGAWVFVLAMYLMGAALVVLASHFSKKLTWVSQ